MAILPDLSAMTREQLEALAMAALKQNNRKLTLKVGKRGNVCVYGLGRFPTTLYASQWDKLLDMADDIRAFIKANASLLSQGKDDPRFASVGDDE